MALWVIRAGKQGEQENTALSEHLVCIGWNKLPDFSKCRSKDELRKLYIDTYADQTENEVAAGLGQVWRFAREIRKGDLVALPRKLSSEIDLGRITGEYQYKIIAPNVVHIRGAEWLKTVPRSIFPEGVLASFNIPRTVFRVSRIETEDYISKILDAPQISPGSDSVPAEAEDESDTPAANLQATAGLQIRSFIQANFRSHALARLIDAVLRAQRYKTRVSPPGPDGGVDILAGTGLLGFDQPRLCVQVKSGSGAADQKVYNELRGVMSKFNSEHGLLVSWGGFTGPVKQDARKDFFKVQLWDKDEIVEAVLDNYERFDEKAKTELPLKRIWALVTGNGE